MTSIRTSFCKDLHAKCYLNESEAILTSMNLYEFSQVNNNEMGIHIDKNSDPDLYNDIYEEAQRFIRISDEIVISVEKSLTKEKQIIKQDSKLKTNTKNGYCIRTRLEIPFNIEKPLSNEAFKKWSEYSNPEFKDKFCHFSVEPSNGETSVKRPILNKNWKKAKEIFGF